jgi:two-component system, chemotaxis family, sensor kinase CheA
MVSLDQFKVGFLTECDELLADMEAMLVQLTPENADKDTLNAIFRCAHSIKGGSGAFGLDSIMNFTHILEALLDSMREDKVPVSTEAVDSLLQAVDVVNAMVAAAKDDVVPPASLGAELARKLQSLASSGAEEVPVVAVKTVAMVTDSGLSEKTYHINFIAHETLLLSGNEPLLILRELCGFGTAKVDLAELNPSQCYLSWQIELTTVKSEADIKEVFEFVDDNCDLNIKEIKQNAVMPQVFQVESKVEENITAKQIAVENKANDKNIAEKPEEKQFARRASDANANATIRVDLDKVDKLVNIVGELVITEAMIKAQIRNLPADQFASLMHRVEELSHHTRELQESVMSVRMQPVKSIFSRMPRIVRDLSAQLGKDIVLHTEGENTEVDKTVIEQLGDPLTHMIRH